MTIPIRAVTAFAHVTNMTASIAFYEKLGFRVANTFVPPGHTGPVWAWLGDGASSLMIAQADGPIDGDQQAVLFYVYVDDVHGKRNELVALGIEAGEIQYRFYAERGEFRVADPDGYVLMIMNT
jgi:catechol 2,3-dioxygenase-like lactoylglutathione lyase family enzyme